MFKLTPTLRGLTDDKLLQLLAETARKVGRDTITIDEYNTHGIGHASTFQRRFGSWPNALERAGLQQSRSKIGIPSEDLFDNLKQLWITLGRQPKYTEAKAPQSRFSAGTYEKRFGSWTKALQAFVDWVNEETVSPRAETKINTIAEEEQTANNALPARDTQRAPSERLRFTVLLRDGFRCMSCGASPISKPGTELHVDHIIPWSKGGETVSENLTTKCSRCNLGKGNMSETK